MRMSLWITELMELMEKRSIIGSIALKLQRWEKDCIIKKVTPKIKTLYYNDDTTEQELRSAGYYKAGTIIDTDLWMSNEQVVGELINIVANRLGLTWREIEKRNDIKLALKYGFGGCGVGDGGTHASVWVKKDESISLPM